MNFFFDANMSPRLARMIAALCEGEHQVVHITEHEDFRSNNKLSDAGKIRGNRTQDVEWLRVLGRSGQGWKVVSGDLGIRYRTTEYAALQQSGLIFFAMDRNWGNMSIAEQAWKLVKAWSEILKHAAKAEQRIYLVQTGHDAVRVVPFPATRRARGN